MTAHSGSLRLNIPWLVAMLFSLQLRAGVQAENRDPNLSVQQSANGRNNWFEAISDLITLGEAKAKSGRVNEAAALYDEANDKLNGILVGISSPNSRAALISKMSQLYLKYYNLAATQLNDLGKAFYILEQARGRNIAEGLPGRPDVPLGQNEAGGALESELARAQGQLWSAREVEKRKESLDKVFEIYSRMRPRAEMRSRSLESVLFKPTDLSTLQASLYPDEVVLEYVLQEPNSSCLVISKDRAKGISLPGRRHIEDLIDRYRREISSRTPALELAKELYDCLLGQVPDLKKAPRITVVADGKLHMLPFESLVGPKAEPLIVSHLVDYAPSATVLFLMRRETIAKRGSLPFLGIGDVPARRENLMPILTPFHASREEKDRWAFPLAPVRLSSLPASRDEVMALSELIGTKSVQLLGEKATEAALKAQPLSEFQILHFAVHGVSSEKLPRKSALVLAPDPALSEDGFFEAWEISRLRLNSDLVVLSACDTGLGHLLEIEGVSNLASSFLAAGAKTVVASLWSADDYFTRTLMKQFYSYLVQGMDKGSALRLAKLALIDWYGPSKAVPFFWAGFVMIGESSTPIFPEP